MSSKEFSVLMSVYSKENPLFLQQCLESILNQTLLPQSIVIVKDGQLPQALLDVLNFFQTQNPELFQIIGYDRNQGLGIALDYGLKVITTTYVARMDTDDIASPARFEEQIGFLLKNPEIDIVGSHIQEFDQDFRNTISIRRVPEHNHQIKKQAHIQNPMNHMTVVFKKEKVILAGSYQHAPFFEDYDLWVRMILKGFQFHNLQTPLVSARVGNDMIGKRHGFSYSKHEYKHFRKMYSRGFISETEFIKAIVLRLPLRLLPKRILTIIYNFILRKKS